MSDLACKALLVVRGCRIEALECPSPICSVTSNVVGGIRVPVDPDV
ncbi:hypothetical protein AB4037_05890 [Labrys sp. KB_33_2]